MFIPGYESNLNMKYFEKSLQEIIYCSEKNLLMHLPAVFILAM